jgi:preprotein translocase subunit SecD
MLNFPRWKIWLVLFFAATGVAMALPTILPSSITSQLPARLRSTKINLGLDLAGGSHLLLEADTGDVAKQRIERMDDSIHVEMRRNEPKIEIGEVLRAGGELSFLVRDPGQLDKAVERARNLTAPIGNLTGQRDWNVAVRDSSRIVMTPTEAGLNDEINKALETAVSVIHKRIDPEGTKEVTVIRQGASRILVQVPGEQNPEALKALLGKTAKLEFKLVDLTADPAQVAQGNAPPGSQVVPYPEDPSGLKKIAVLRRVMVSGDQLTNASQGYDQQTNAPVVNITFDSQGSRRFARTTQDNVGKPFAMILDGTVLSAPNIRDAILGGQAQISGNFTVDSANQLAIALRSGKLPVALKVVEERTVGPDLGRDSIVRGVRAGVIATVLLILFMLVTYFRFGVYTTISLVVNALMILGAMALFNATLTLPGIAGFVLTIGAAVDANVLINERIREELKRGRNTLAAVEFGYKEASRAIFDANVTNVISAIIMFWFGSGPVKGFAVVLAIGIVTSVFTGVTLTRLMVSNYLKRARPRTLTL